MSKHSAGHDGGHADNPQQQKDNHERRISGAVSVSGSVKADLPQQLLDEYAASNEKADTREKRRVFREFATLFFLILTAGFTFIQAYQSVKSANAAKSAADVAAKQLEMAERPWIEAGDFQIVSPLAIEQNGEGARLTIRFTPHNIGHSPAVLVNPEVRLSPSYIGIPDPRQARRDACRAAITGSQIQHNKDFMETWFPGELPPRDFGLVLSRKDIEDAMQARFQWHPPAPADHIELQIAVCIAYQSSFADTQYHTGYVLDLERMIDNPPFVSDVFESKPAIIPPEKLRLTYDTITANGADAN
jgi:hypothetical protein